MFKLRNLTKKLAHLNSQINDACYRSQNTWDGGIFTMVQHLLFFSKHRGYEFLEFCCWNLVPFLPDLSDLSICWRVCGRLWHIFCLMIHQMFSIGERSGLQAGQFSTRTLPLRSHAVLIAVLCGFALSCWNTQGLPWNKHLLEGSICCSKTFIYLSAFIVLPKTCKLPIMYVLMHHHTIRDAGFWQDMTALRVSGPCLHIQFTYPEWAKWLAKSLWTSHISTLPFWTVTVWSTLQSTRTTRHRNSFFPQAIHLMNTWY